MQLPPEPNRNVAEKTALLCLALLLHALEFFIPRIPLIPWFKPGLANAVTIVWIIRYGAIDAVLLTLLRIWISGFYFGFSFLTIALSLSGGLTATFVMGFFWTVAGKRRLLGTVGLGILGAFAHNMGQLGIIRLLLIPSTAVLLQIPFMIPVSLGLGAVVGALAYSLWHTIEKTPVTRHLSGSIATAPVTPLFIAGGLSVLGISFGLVFVDHTILLAASAGSATLAGFWCNRFGLRKTIRPIARFWMLFLFVGILNIMVGFGKRLPGPLPITYEGLQAAGHQWLRLWTWLQLTFLFRRLRFHDSVVTLFRRVFPGHRFTLAAGMLALESLPEIIALAKPVLRKNLHTISKRPLAAPGILVTNAYREVIILIETASALRTEPSGAQPTTPVTTTPAVPPGATG